MRLFFTRYRSMIRPISFICPILCIKSLSEIKAKILNANTHFKSLATRKGKCHKSIYMFAEVLFALIVRYFCAVPSPFLLSLFAAQREEKINLCLMSH